MCTVCVCVCPFQQYMKRKTTEGILRQALGYTFIHSTWKVDVERSPLVQGQPELHNETLYQNYKTKLLKTALACLQDTEEKI